MRIRPAVLAALAALCIGSVQLRAPYESYLGDKFSHCGVDALHLAKLPEGWKLIALSDTQRREGCGQGK